VAKHDQGEWSCAVGITHKSFDRLAASFVCERDGGDRDDLVRANGNIGRILAPDSMRKNRNKKDPCDRSRYEMDIKVTAMYV
jgi:hypothetical protein